MGMFDGIGGVKASGDRTYFPADCRFRVRIESVRLISAGESGKGVNSFIISATVLVSSNPAAMPVGVEAAQVITWDPVPAGGRELPTKTKMAFANVRQFLDAVLGGVADGEVQEAAEMVGSAANPVKGAELDLTTRNSRTKAGTDFTKHHWTRVPA
jgi:hypothetical protein